MEAHLRISSQHTKAPFDFATVSPLQGTVHICYLQPLTHGIEVLSLLSCLLWLPLNLLDSQVEWSTQFPSTPKIAKTHKDCHWMGMT